MADRIKAIIAAIRARLVDDVTNWYKHFSMWLAGLMALATSFLAYSPDIALQVVNQLPPDMRKFLPEFVGPALFALIFVARYWNQRKTK